ncbi:putative phosphoenolpyruvate phosphomutase [Aspergillus violaceofuscus CBS 115571]|uniref:Putative phosphoenolpyruvate phosphomutase n=1 Tax=Aspergillus violaceofuscus (strain CBS 115571) TaxID=1450538 RepID=A0A2V5H724_ASPV1|nr:putative phosphoenolpyruvate phosphomutase [Aspergillus violaceofuscus CBS 115571]
MAPKTSTNAARLRQLLARPGPVLLVGAHDALSARIAEHAGFDAIWASGFGISATHALPDANILTMSETLEAAQRMAEAVTCPVVADCDNGFGNAINVMRTVTQCERAGLAGVCIEDNIFPKRCSFYEGVQRELTAPHEHALKIQAAVDARTDPDFVVIARTEAFIAGRTKNEALERARAYADAGADAVLVHSKSDSFEELREFAAAWDRSSSCVLVAVPTTYEGTSADELFAAGFKVVIFANQALRAAVRAMQDAMVVLQREARPAAVRDSIASLSEIYGLVGVKELKESEERFLPRPDPSPVANRDENNHHGEPVGDGIQVTSKL